MRNNCLKGGPYDRCVQCPYLGNGCDGPRTSSMTTERWCEFVFMLKKARGYTSAEIAKGSGVGDTTVERIMAGTYPKDIMRSTAGAIEDFLIGSHGKYPCAMDSAPPTYQDTLETQAKIERLRADKEHFKKSCETLQASLDKEVAAIREEYQRQIDYLKEEIAKKDKRIEKLIDKLTE